MDVKICVIAFLLAVLATDAVFGEKFCPECTCPVEYSPICGKQRETGKLRGFTSRCTMECSNKCKTLKFDFYKNGRCGTRKKNPLAFFAEAQTFYITPPTNI